MVTLGLIRVEMILTRPLEEQFKTERTIQYKYIDFSYSNTESIRDDPYWSSGKNSLKLIELSSMNKVSLV